MDKKDIGDLGEAFAARYFQKRGYTINKMNYHSRYGEIDVIAENDEWVVFVEVKTRKGSTMLSPCDAVGKAKQKKIILTAMDYLSKSESEKASRFDVFEVWQNEGKIFKFNHIEHAFDSEDFSSQYEIF